MTPADWIATTFIVVGLVGAAILVHCFWIDPPKTKERGTSVLRHPALHAVIGTFAATLLYVPVPVAQPR